MKLGEARKVIRHDRRATGNIPGTAELLLTYVENGVMFTHEFGDVDDRFYDSIESAPARPPPASKGREEESESPSSADSVNSPAVLHDGEFLIETSPMPDYENVLTD